MLNLFNNDLEGNFLNEIAMEDTTKEDTYTLVFGFIM